MEFNKEKIIEFTKRIRENFPAKSNNSWIENLNLVNISKTKVILGGIPHRVYRYEIKTNHEKLIIRILDEIFPEMSPFSNKIFEYKIGVPKNNEDPIQTEFDFNKKNLDNSLDNKFITKNNFKHKKLPVNYNYNHLLDSFIPGKRNLLAIRSSRIVVELPGIAFNPFVIYGESGSGKTHLLEGISNEVHKKDTNISSIYISAEDFLNDFINSLRSNKMKDFRDLYRNPNILLIDDLESILPSKKCQNELIHTFKALKKKNSQIAIVCEKPPSHIVGLDPSLKRFLESGLTVDMGIPDDNTKIEILIKKAAEKGIPLNSDLAYFIVSKIKGGVGRMEGVLMRLGVHASLLNEKLTIDLVNEIIKDWLNESEKSKNHSQSHRLYLDETIEKILKRIGILYQISENELVSYKRERRHIKARQASVYLLKKLTKLSLSEIGKLIGRNHSTVHAILKKLKCKKVLEDDFFNKQMQNILNEFNNKTSKDIPDRQKRDAFFVEF